ncbi:MAG: sulfotransferase [Cyclobacteriaceae bacterium]
MEMNRPNFMVIGAGKSGTTTLYHWLQEHPEVFLTPIKETNYFALKNTTWPIGPDPDQMHNFPDAITQEKDYISQYENRSSKHKAAGEVCPMYLYHPKAAKNIKAFNPATKLIVILRQPAERLYSRHMHLTRENRALSFGNIFDKESLWWKRNDLIKEGFYYKHLKFYFKVFRADQILVLLYEDLVNDNVALIKSVYTHIGVNPDFQPTLDNIFNKSGKVNNQLIDRFIGQNSIAKKYLKAILPFVFEKIRSNHSARQLITNLRNRNLHKIPPQKGLLENITNSVYSKDITQLQKLIQRDLSHWFNLTPTIK